MKKWFIVLFMGMGFSFLFPQNTLRFGLFPLYDAKTMIRLFSPLTLELEEATGCNIQLFSAPDKETFHRRTLENRYDLIWTSNAFYFDAHAVAGWYAILRGTPSFYGILMVRKDSGIENLEDLRGKKIAAISTVSLAGYLFLRNDLADLGLYPGEDYQIDFFERSESIPFMINSGTVDAGVFSEDTLVRSSILGTIRDNLKTIHRSIPIPQFPVAVCSDFDPLLVEKIQAALGGFSADHTELGRSLTELNLTGLEAVSDDDYESFRRLYLKVRDYPRERVGE